jgi:hypothetical protein
VLLLAVLLLRLSKEGDRRMLPSDFVSGAVIVVSIAALAAVLYLLGGDLLYVAKSAFLAAAILYVLLEGVRQARR